MIPSFGRANNFRRQLQMAHDKLPPSAEDKGETSCCRSGRCCWSGPCELAPPDAPKVAAHLGLTLPELFAQHLVIDERRGDDGLRVMPRRKQQEGGHYLTDAETYDAETPCAFLTDANECQIQDVKPAGGAHFKCWDKATHGSPPGCSWTRDEVMDIGWDGFVPEDE